MRRLAAIIIVLLASPARAQVAAHQHGAAAAGWEWGASANVFAGYNYQWREFTDFDEVESQNWLMASGARAFGRSRAGLEAMFSFEAFTLRDIGSPQVFQTGETYNGAPLIDYQHPHDLFMNLGGSYAHLFDAATISVRGYLVGPAPVGPPVFMYRPSAAENPQSPLGHHHLDATHISPGVVTLGVERAGFLVEAGAFHGQEPDEDRLDLDTAALDSWAARVSWTRGAWSMQVSGADMKTPERSSPYDASRLTASVSYTAGDANRSVAWLAAFGQNREVFGNLEAYLIEGTHRRGRRAYYLRAESVAKDILDAGFHPIGTTHTHRQSQVSALTLGYVRDIAVPRWGSFGVGGDVTGYLVPQNLSESYGHPLSFHVFLRYRGRVGHQHSHEKPYR
jgi:hypothetical protein